MNLRTRTRRLAFSDFCVGVLRPPLGLRAFPMENQMEKSSNLHRFFFEKYENIPKHFQKIPNVKTGILRHSEAVFS